MWIKTLHLLSMISRLPIIQRLAGGDFFAHGFRRSSWCPAFLESDDRYSVTSFLARFLLWPLHHDVFLVPRQGSVELQLLD